MDENYDLGGSNIIMTGEGTFRFNGHNITNYGTIVMRGTSSTERLTNAEKFFKNINLMLQKRRE